LFELFGSGYVRVPKEKKLSRSGEGRTQQELYHGIRNHGTERSLPGGRYVVSGSSA
jgi:hypothetical protein